MEEEMAVDPSLTSRAMRLVTRGDGSTTFVAVSVGAGSNSTSVSRPTTTALVDTDDGLEPPSPEQNEEPRTERNDSATGSPRTEVEAWGAGEDEDGWMPKPARLHSGKTRACAVCFAPLQYTSAASWDEYLLSEEYLTQLQANVLQDAFVSALICGENTAGDLPTEHRMHKNRKLKCRQSVQDYLNMTSAGVVDKTGKEKGSIRTLEELLVDALPTPVFTQVLERRLAVISHSSKIACELMKRDAVQKCSRPLEVAPSSDELHHLAIHTLSALLNCFDYSNLQAIQSFEELSRVLTCFPVLSLYSFWSPAKKPPDKPLALAQDSVQVSSTTSSSRSHGAFCAVDGTDDTFWQSQPRPGTVNWVLSSSEMAKVTSIAIYWHMKYIPESVGVQYRATDTDSFVQLAEERVISASAPMCIATRFPKSCQEIRLVMSGIPSSNRNGTYAIQHLKLNVPAVNPLFVDPKSTLNDVAQWLLGALANADQDLAMEAIGALRAWALATASLSVTMLFVEMLVKFDLENEGVLPFELRAFILKQGRLLCEGIEAYHTEKTLRLTREEEEKGSSDIRRVPALFETSSCSTGVLVEDGGLVVRTRETSYQYAAVNCGVSSGKASWKFRLDTDTQDDEMTCFGAAILPVTVNGYDSSPSLWMLRGYNGNLYARGHKLSRSIGKVHPGDIVQIDVDMSEGTLAFKINGTEYGVVFTDLAGHEVHPAVSFYGSGKVITLLGMSKWDCASSGPTDVDLVYLSSLREYHFSVGYGTLGKGGQLGYASDADSRVPPGNGPVGVSSSIQINGDAKQRCLSTHPPSQGDAYVTYDLAEAYHTVNGAVAINDDTGNEILQQRGVSIVFLILGDGVLLWQSKAITEVRQVEQFDVSVMNVRMLELKVSCPGSNQCAHAVWVDPCLHPVKDWTCSECSFVNRGVSKMCTVCGKGMRVENSKSVALLADSESDEPLSNGSKPQLLSTMSEDSAENSQSFCELGTRIIQQVHELCQRRSQGPNTESVEILPTKSPVQFEEPFCRQPNKDAFALLLSLLRRFRGECVGTSTSSIREGCVHILGIISANLESMDRYDVVDSVSELGMSSEFIADLRGELEAVANIREKGDSDTSKVPEDLEIAAARTIVAGISVVYPSPAEKLVLLLQLLRSYLIRPSDSTSGRYFVLSAMMQLLASPGQNGVLTFLPFMTDNSVNKETVNSSEGEGTSIPAVQETLALLMQIVVNSHRIQLADGAQDSDRSEGELPKIALRLLKTYQLYLLAEAVELTKISALDSEEMTQKDANQLRIIFQRRVLVQEATTHFGFLSLNAYRDLIERLVGLQAEEAFALSQQAASLQANVRAYEIPLLSEVLPWFVSCVCLLRRQTWLARPILPAVTRFLGTLDHYCSELEIVSKSAHRLQKLEAYQNSRAIEAQGIESASKVEAGAVACSRSSKRLYNVFRQLYTGEKDHFEGQIGFQFEATSSFSIIALGRSVNPTRNGGRLTREHTIRLWEEGSQLLIAHVTVNGSSKKDALGYALEALVTPARITQGKLYRLTTQEFANGGDPWYKKENLPDEDYDDSFIKVLRDCYASGSAGFPGSQNMMGAAYGVPTLLVQDETPLASLPRFVPPHGCLALKFNTKKKLNSVCVSHTGTSAYVKDESDTWRTCFLRTAFIHGVHSVDFAVKSNRIGGAVSGHVCIGVDWQNCSEEDRKSSDGSCYESFLGENATSIGWMPAIGAVWVQGTRFDYGTKLSVAAGDIFTLTVDYDLQVVSFAYNGQSMGIAVGRPEFRPKATTLSCLPEVVTAGVSLFGSQDVVQIRPSGIARSTLRIHWLFDLHNSLASLAGRITSTLIAGYPVDGVEEELLPWLQSPLLSGGIVDNLSEKDPSGSVSSLLGWKDALQAEFERNPSNDHASQASLLAGLAQDTSSSFEGDLQSRTRGSGGRGLEIEGLNQRERRFWDTWTQDMTENGTVQLILSWLEKHSPDRTFLSRLGKFPLCERWMCAALIKHAPSHVLQEVQAISEGAGVNQKGQGAVGTEFFLAHANLTPSEDLIRVWKRIITLRHWLIKTRQEYRAKEADESVAPSSGLGQTPLESEAKSAESLSELADSSSNMATRKRIGDGIDLEQSLVVPKSFNDLLDQVSQRAEFLCKLAQPSEEAERLKGDSQVALFNLAEKWSAQQTPPSLQPMLERWKTLGEADSSKWSGIVDVLRAQDRWRTRRASIQTLAMPSLEMKQQIPTESGENDEDLVVDRKFDYTNSFSAMMKACDLYIRDGIGAPPEILQALLERRQRRSDSRLFGLHAMKSILSLLSYDSAIHNAIIFLRPAMRGFTDGEKESRELNDGQVVAETFRATVRHHYLKGLEGCNRTTIKGVQYAFCDLYGYLAQLLGRNSGQQVSDPQLKQAIMCAWSLDFEPRDHRFLLETGMLSKLQELFSISSVLREAVADNGGTIETGNLESEYSSINWHPLSEEFVQQGLLHSGFVTKRDIVRLLRRAPSYSCPTSWWKKNELELATGEPAGSPASRHTASSLSLLYSDMLSCLERKLSGSAARLPSSKVLQFGTKISSVSTRGTSASQNPKPEEISYVETPALGEVQAFTLELWVFPTELSGCRALRCDNGLQDGSLYVELVGRCLQLTIPGNFPREQLFTHPLRTHEWTHIAVVYDADAKLTRLFVNGAFSEEKLFERVGKTVHLRTARLGCWMSGVDTQGAALTNVSAQRKFKGAIAEVRVWRVARTEFEIDRDFQLSVPVTKREASAAASDLIALWHLREGDGMCGFDRATSWVRTMAGSYSPEDSEAVEFHSTIAHCRWVQMNSPVFESPRLDSLSPERWSRVLSCVRSFQRKVRQRLRLAFEASIRLSKLVCEHEERTALLKWSQLSRDEEFDEEFDEESDGESYPARSPGLDAATSKLLAQWSACTDEQLLLRKQTRRCAWIVFRFLASTGISGIHERREGEAKSVAAVAKLKRKQRLQKAGSLGSVLSPMNRLPGTPKIETDRGLSYDEEDVAARTAEAASDAAKSAASNRELEEPKLQTLWFSTEFHRKVFEVLEKELLQGKELTEEAEGLTRAQRMLRSVSTPVQKRGSSLRQYPSDLAANKTGFVDLHHAPSELSANSELLEPLEVEMHMFGVLSFMLSQSGQSSALSYLVRPHMLRGLLEMLRLASPRSQRVVKLLLRRICCSGSIKPADVSAILGSESVLVDLLLDQVAESICSTAAPMPTHAVNVPSSSALAGNPEGGGSSGVTTESLSNPIGFRSGQISLVLASESVALLRLLLMEKTWQQGVAENLCNAIRNVAPNLAKRQADSPSRDASDSTISSDIRIRAAIIRAVGALCVLGSHSDCLRVGGQVSVAAQGIGSNAADAQVDDGFSFVGGGGRSVSATLIEMNARASRVRVVFHPSSEEFDPSHNVQDVNLSTLSPTEEICLPPSVVPLTLDMMPVILQLASLEDASILAEFDDLWRLQIRSRALLALEAILRHSLHITKSIAHEAMAQNLLRSAVTPISLSSFVSLPFLQERGRMILCRLIESSTPLGEAMFRGLEDPKLPIAAESEVVVPSGGSEANEDPAEEETEAHRIRRGFASTLAAMGFEFELCMAALEHSRNDPNLAVEWLMGAGAAAYQERQQAQRLVQASLAASETTEADGGASLTLEAKVIELQSISGMPYCVALCALELSNSDPNRAMEWLMEHGEKYVEKQEALELLTDSFCAARTVVLEDRAAMEEIDQPDPLVTISGRRDSPTSATSTAAGSSRGSERSNGESANATAVTLAPILASVPIKPPTSSSGSAASRDTNATGLAPLDPDYLPPNVLLTVSSDIGPVQHLATSGRTGIYRRYSPEDGVLITFLNTESGAYEDEWHFPRDVRRIVKIYDEPLEGVESIHRVALRTENALSTHYARRAITALLRAFDPAVETPAGPLDGDLALEDKAPSPLASLADEILNVVGGPRQFVSLLKLVAASEMTFTQRSTSDGRTGAASDDGSTSIAGDRKSASDHARQSGSLLQSLQRIALRILREEARSGKFRKAKWSPSRQRESETDHREQSRATAASAPAIPESGGSVPRFFPEETSAYDEDEALSQAIALSIQEADGGSPTAPLVAVTQERRHDDAEEKSEEPRDYLARRMRQPSDTEAQEVASAYLGGGVDDHDGLLSSVLVKECVSHFVESTRVAGDGSCGPSAVQEFQSLHPYFGRCEYARAVSIDSSFRCLRVVFDHRCRLGAKAKLSFFADPECEDRLGVVDSGMTTSGHLLSDLIIHSHQFWFRFTASEENAAKDNGYGYRFQVKPMASIRWTKEEEVLANPSLEWACWVLELLLNDATELMAHGAVHNRKIYGALVRYLRSPGAPFKGRVVRLLLQLLHRPELFPANEVPELDALESITQLALARAESYQASGKVFLSTHLLQLVELSMVLSTASTAFDRTLNGVGAGLTLSVPTPLALPTPFDRKSVRDSLNDVSEITRFLLGHTTCLAPHILVAIWLEVYGATAIIESRHPYTADAPVSDSTTFEGAQALQIAFDSRCAVASGRGETTPRLELVSFSLLAKSEDTSSATESVREVRSNRTYAGESGWPSGVVSLDGDDLEYTFHADGNTGGHFGFAATVTAVGYPKEKQIARATPETMAYLLQKLVAMQTSLELDEAAGDGWTRAMDLQLVDWVNNHVEPTASLVTPAPARRSIELKPTDIRLHHLVDGLRCSQLLGLSLESLQLRFALLKYLNQSLHHCLPLLDLRDTQSTWTVAHRLRQLSHCVFFDVKSALVDAGIEATNVSADTTGGSSQQTARITLDRLQALESRDDREVEPSVSQCFFAQAFRQLHHVDPALFRRQIDSKGRLFSVKFRGEEGVDWGGVYREGATSMVDDLFSPHFSLFVLCPNGQHDTGGNRGMYLPNPKCTSPVAMQMLAFVGQLLGISLRTHGDFPFMLPSPVWKQLLGHPLGRADLEGTDAMFVQMLDGIANCENDGISTEDEFATAFAGLELRFTASSCTGEELELVPDGRQRIVTFANRLEYCRLAERARLEECSTQVAAMARGFATLFPRRVLTLLTWQELELLTCGSPKIDLALWQRHTRYDGYAEDDPTVRLFWEVLGDFSDEQRTDFVRFAWGRSRLPRGKWPQPFKLSKKGGRDATHSLPVAHTCFFSVELPPYTTREIMHSRLLATITFGLGGILMA